METDVSTGGPMAVVIVALVGWIAIRLALGLLRQAGVDVRTSVGWEAGDDGTHHGSGDHAGNGGSYGGGGDRDGGH